MSRSDAFNRLNYILAPVGGSNIDPLITSIYPRLQKLPQVKQRFSSEFEQGRPDLVSYLEFSTVDLWWVVLQYNGILRSVDLVAGILLKFPDYIAVTAMLRDSRSNRVLAINNKDPTLAPQVRRSIVI